MGIYKRDCTSIEFVRGTLGGKTFYVKHPKWENEERATCFRPLSKAYQNGHSKKSPQAILCERPAGHNTDHFGEGACKSHGGHNGRVNTISNGTRAKQTKKGMARRIDDFLKADKDALLNLMYELSTVRIIFQDMVEMFPEPHEDDYSLYVNRATSLVTSIGSLVDKISRIEQRNTITAAQVMYLRATVADLLIKHIDDPGARERAVRELQSRMPGGNQEALPITINQ